jgi:glycosyltransferase involved in cell wall biosynthesis
MAKSPVLVVVPSYNHGCFIRDRLRSILNQTESNFVVHVVDDGSNDQTMDVLGSFDDPRLTVRRRDVNSGSPFTTWLETGQLIEKGGFEYVWIAESDDRAEVEFLERGLARLQEVPDAALYFCHSWYVDDNDLIIGHSINYLRRMFPDLPWDSEWQMSGTEFIRNGLIRGMAVPNMSSALIRADMFRSALRSSFNRYKLAADWIFAIEIAKAGGVVFDSWDGNHFRHHARTSRSETSKSRMLFEHMSATRRGYLSGAVDNKLYAQRMKIWTDMFRRDKVSISEFVRHGWKISKPELFESLLQLAGWTTASTNRS